MTNATNSKRRVVLDAILKAIDVTVAFVALGCGVIVFLAPPPTILREVSLPQLIALWGVFLIVGGFCGSVGRLTGIWLLETSGIALMGTGIAIYLAVVSTAIVRELGVAVATGLILVALLTMAKRYVELQAFLSEPGDVSLIARLRALLRIRTSEPRP